MAIVPSTTQTQISKLALSLLKGEDVTSIDPPDQGVKEARVMALWFGDAAAYALEQHPWKFARHRTSIPADNTAPSFEYTYRYELPPDFIRPVRIGEKWYDPEGDYEIEGNYFLCNESAPLKLVYIRAMMDVSKWTPTFRIYMAYVLAAFACYDITGAKDMVPLMFEAAEEFLSKGKSVNIQARPPRKIQHSRLKRARMSVGSLQDEPWRWGDD